MSLFDLCPHERQIIAQLLDDAGRSGFLVSVFDGEGYAVKQSSDQTAIRLNIGATDETTLVFRDPARLDDNGNPARVGTVFLVHGNGADVLSDWSDNGPTRVLLSSALAVANRLSVAA